MAHIRTALDTARTRLDLVILLGLDPESPEVEYGWIEPTAPIVGHSRVFGVRRFWEKPNQLLAQVLHLRGCLWNSFVMVAAVQMLIDIIESAIPELYAFLRVPLPSLRFARGNESRQQTLRAHRRSKLLTSSVGAQPGAACGGQGYGREME